MSNNSKETISFVRKVSEIFHDTTTTQSTLYEYNIYEVIVETGKKFGFTYYNSCKFSTREDGMIFTGDPFPRSYLSGSQPIGGWESVQFYSTLKDRLLDQVKIDEMTDNTYGEDLHRIPFTEENIKNICHLWENKAF